jgi:hypothetical protein
VASSPTFEQRLGGLLRRVFEYNEAVADERLFSRNMKRRVRARQHKLDTKELDAYCTVQLNVKNEKHQAILKAHRVLMDEVESFGVRP